MTAAAVADATIGTSATAPRCRPAPTAGIGPAGDPDAISRPGVAPASSQLPARYAEATSTASSGCIQERLSMTEVIRSAPRSSAIPVAAIRMTMRVTA
jgi:hypothetical protein